MYNRSVGFLDRIADKYKSFAPLLLRAGLALVFLLFAYHKLHLHTTGQGVAEVQLLFNLGLGTASAINFYTGLLELAIGLMLVMGWHIRLAGLISSGMIFFIFISYLYQQGVSIRPDLYRDLGLATMGLAIFLLGKMPKAPITPQQ